MTDCSKCGQTLPNPLEKKTLEHMDKMLKIWISLLMQPTKELITTEQFDRLFNPKVSKK